MMFDEGISHIGTLDAVYNMRNALYDLKKISEELGSIILFERAGCKFVMDWKTDLNEFHKDIETSLKAKHKAFIARNIMNTLKKEGGS